MSERPRHRAIAAAMAGVHLVVTAWTWRDLDARRPDQVRGSKAMWRVLSVLNTSGSLAYVVIGRRAR